MTVFLSASIPLPDRDAEYFETADVVAIRDAVKSFIQIIAPHHQIHFGGHPAITPLISLLMQRHPEIKDQRITLYQSEYFRDKFPQENFDFVNSVYIQAVNDDREESLEIMRRRMVSDRPIRAAVFIGGMEGVIEEYKLVRETNPDAICFPISSTGGAALKIFRSGEFPEFLDQQLTYRTLFRNLLNAIS